MDSGSGSLQSSSGGDEEYDSHHHHHHPQLFPPPPTPPLFFNPNIPPPPSIPHPHPHHHQQQHQFPFHLSHHNYQTPHLQPTNLYDFPSDFNPNFNPSDSFVNPTSLRSDPGSSQNRQTTPPSAALHPKPTAKKRTRASRRAPTTVLTTDTTNFRAMVQEFTGIPSPPFTAAGSSSSSYSSYSRRFDLFGSGSGLYPSRSKVQLLSSLNTSSNAAAAAMEDQNAVRNFSFQSEGGTHLEPLHINCSTTTTGQQQQILSVLQNEHDIAWRGSSTAGIIAAAEAVSRSSNNNNAAGAAAAGAANCKFNFTGSSSSSSNILQLQRDKEILLGNVVVSTTTTTRGESTVNSWIYPSD